MNHEMPYKSKLIPVQKGVKEFESFIASFPGFSFCPYVADKTADEWDVSTSRRYMNQVLENFLYIPVNIPNGDNRQIEKLLEMVALDKTVAAINITKPHKSAPVLKKIFLGSDTAEGNIDTLIKNNQAELVPYDLNAAAFVGWFTDVVGSFNGRDVVLIGVGGVGEPIAKHIVNGGVASLQLVDPDNKSELALRLNANYVPSVAEADAKSSLVIINASGKDGVSDDSGITEFLQQSNPSGGVFIDIRPQLKLPIVEFASQLGWRAFTGNGMNARNDYELLKGICRYLNVRAMPFEEFDRLVADAS